MPRSLSFDMNSSITQQRGNDLQPTLPESPGHMIQPSATLMWFSLSFNVFHVVFCSGDRLLYEREFLICVYPHFVTNYILSPTNDFVLMIHCLHTLELICDQFWLPRLERLLLPVLPALSSILNCDSGSDSQPEAEANAMSGTHSGGFFTISGLQSIV